jgi:hypothetical protein
MTTTITEDICARLVLLASGCTGIVTALDPPPPGINSDALPQAWVFTGDAQNDDESLGPDMTVITRTFRMQVAVIPTGQADPETRETLCRPLLDNLSAHMRKYPRLNRLAGIDHASLRSDSGVVILPSYGGTYVGFELRLEVQYLQERTYANGE